MRVILVLTLLFGPRTLLAHPVIFQGGWALSSSNMESNANQSASYSLTSSFAVGVDSWRLEDESYHLAKFNTLLYRSNGQSHQANLYLHSGAGIYRERAAGLLGVEGDFETRKLYTSLKHLNFQNHSMFQARLGSNRLSGRSRNSRPELSFRPCISGTSKKP